MSSVRKVVLGVLAAALGLLAILAIGSGIRVLLGHPIRSAEVVGAVFGVGLVIAAVLNRIAPRVRRGTIIELDLSASPPETDDRNPLAALGGGRPLTLRDIIAALERAGRDRRVVGLVVRPRFETAPPAVISELRDALAAFRAAGKPTIAVTDSLGEGGPANSPYYLACGCDEIVVQPSGLVGLTPMSMNANFYRGLLDRLGIEVEVGHRYEYKDAADRLTQRGMTGPSREAIQRVLDSYWEQLVGDIAAARRLTPEAVRTIADQGPLLAREALDGGLIDRLAFSDEAIDEFKTRLGPKSRLLYLSTYKKRAGKGRQKGKAFPVAVLTAAGEIARTSSPVGLTGGPVIGADQLTAHIRKAVADKKVKAVVLRVDSPGGSAVASDSLWRELVRVRAAGKPLVVSMGATAASGGYFLAAAADKVVAQPLTLTGSIGVVSIRPVIGEAKAKLDIVATELHTGSAPGMFSFNRKMTAAQWARLDTQLDDVYNVFTSRVAEGRHLPIEEVHRVAKGRVWTGIDALGLGLVDELGGLDRAMTLAMELANAPDGSRAVLKAIPRTGSLSRVRRKAGSSSEDASVAALAPGSAFSGLGALAGSTLAPVLGAVLWSGSASRGMALTHLGMDPRDFWIR